MLRPFIGVLEWAVILVIVFYPVLCCLYYVLPLQGRRKDRS
jgi:hypothetical protein